MDTNNQSFDWLRQECSIIKSRRFHIFEPLSDSDLVYRCEGRSVVLAGDYADFLREFGTAKLFADYRDAPVVSIYPLKEFRRHTCENGRSFIGFGFRSHQSVFFDEDVIYSGGQSKVYLVTRKNAKEICSCFSEWIREAYEWAKEKYSISQWRKIVAGPKPFSPEEIQVVEARRHFRWIHLGFAQNGDAIFEVENQSLRTIPYLTIGIRDKEGAILVGAVWLDVRHVNPGAKAIIEKDCYKDRIPCDELEPFEMPEPIPEKREGYWEFGVPC